MKKNTILLLLTLMALLSLFGYYSINGMGAYLYDYAFVAIPTLIIQRYQGIVEGLGLMEYIHWMLLVLAHIGVAVLPLLYFKYESKKMLIFIPLSYLVLQLLVLTFIGLVLVSFAIVWVIVLFLSPRANKGNPVSNF